MTAQVQERVRLPEFKDPILVTAFTTPFKAGATASFAVSNLVQQWNAELVAELDANECYNFGRMRPQAIRNGNRTEIQWPTTQIYAATPPGAERTYLFLLGIEPTLNWQAYTSAVSQFATRAGVRTAISVRANPASVSHRQPAQIYAWYSDQSAKEGFGYPELPFDFSGADIGLAINADLQERGCQTIDLFGLEPYYAPALPMARTAHALAAAVAAPFGLSIDDGEFVALAEKQDEALEGMMSASPQLREGIQAIEAQATDMGGQHPALGPASAGSVAQLEEPLDADAAIREVEELLGLDSD